jgi:5,10-methylenetetrahydromethanopterin reductase
LPTPKVRFGLSRLALDIPEYLDWAEYADGAGYDLIGFGDSQTLWADPYSMLALTAARTKHVLLGTTVTNPVTRHPAVTANSIMTLQKISGGRAFLGIGPGDSAIYNIGEKPLSRPEFEEYVLAVKGLTKGEEVTYQGKPLKLHWDTTPVPMMVAGDGTKMLQLAGKIGDLVICGGGGAPETVRHALENVAIGARSVGRDPNDIPVWFLVRVHVAESWAAGVEQLRFYMAAYANVHFRYAPHDKGVEVPPKILEGLRGVQREYRRSEHVKPGSTYNADLLVKYGLVEWIARLWAVTGPPNEIIKRLEELIEAGARNMILPQLLPNATETTRELAQKILPAFK